MRRRDLFKIILGTATVAVLGESTPLNSHTPPLTIKCGRAVGKSTSLTRWQREVMERQREAILLDHIRPLHIKTAR